MADLATCLKQALDLLGDATIGLRAEIRRQIVLDPAGKVIGVRDPELSMRLADTAMAILERAHRMGVVAQEAGEAAASPLIVVNVPARGETDADVIELDEAASR